VPTTRRTFLRTATLASAALAAPSLLTGKSRARVVRPGDFMMIDLPGISVSADEAAFIREHGVRGVCVFARNIQSEAQLRGLSESLRALIGPDALVAIDQEGGGVWRTRFLPFAPSAMALGAANDPALARRVGYATARGLRSMGINWDFAPVLDVNNNPRNPVISDRSFAGNAEQVSRLAIPWMQGAVEAGIAPCVKHFPGHGDTAVDSHYGLPTVDKPRAVLDTLELAPFRDALAAGAPAVMTTHILFPALDREHPATLSRPILTGLLRDEFRYDGVIVTDSMGMQGITDHYGRGQAGELALRAGADMLCALGNMDARNQTVEGVERLLRDGAMATELNRKRARLTALSDRFPVRAQPYDAAARADDAATMAEGWTKGLTAWNTPQPIRAGSPLTLVVAQGAIGGGASDPGMQGLAIIERLAPHYDLRVVTYDPQTDPNATALPFFQQVHRPGTPVVFASTSRQRPAETIRSFAAALNPTLHLALWNPFTVLDVNAPALVSFGYRPEALDAVVRWMKGEVQATGRFPVDVAA